MYLVASFARSKNFWKTHHEYCGGEGLLRPPRSLSPSQHWTTRAVRSAGIDNGGGSVATEHFYQQSFQDPGRTGNSEPPIVSGAVGLPLQNVPAQVRTDTRRKL